MLTVTDPPGDRLPVAGVKLTPLKELLAAQLTLFCELDVSASVIVQLYVLLEATAHCELLGACR